MDGTRYIDYQLGFGPVILGHGYEPVVGAVAEAARAGSFAMTQRREATMHAIRLARGFTGGDTVVKVEGQYHGVHDYVMFSTAGAPP